MRNRTIVLVTHALNLVCPEADHIILMKDGQVASQGNYPQMKDIINLSAPSIDADAQELRKAASDDSAMATNTEAEDDLQSIGPSKLIEEETHRTGQVHAKVYTTYFQSGGGWGLGIGLLFLMGIAQTSSTLQDWWVQQWSNECDMAADACDKSTDYYLGIYGGISGATVLFLLAKMVILAAGSLSASRQLHHRLLEVLLRAPIRFFDKTPVGRILNRFGKDVQTIDQEIMNNIGDWLTIGFNAGAIVLVIAAVTPIFLVAVVPISTKASLSVQFSQL
jgi:ABC-type multidrug transport system fused ATPase/permease subunit